MSKEWDDLYRLLQQLVSAGWKLESFKGFTSTDSKHSILLELSK